METGQLIKELRKARQLTQDELAKDITSRTTLSSIENRNQNIPFYLLEKLLDRLNIRLEEFSFLLNEGLPNGMDSYQEFKSYGDYAIPTNLGQLKNKVSDIVYVKMIKNNDNYFRNFKEDVEEP